jgi:ADP-ribose pyrophosphatase YjhB (NUDIX family)
MDDDGLMEDTKPFPWNFCPVCGAGLTRENDGERIRPFCASCNRFYYRNPTPAVCGLLVCDGGLLLVRRGVEPAYGRWALPGGFMEAGESIEDAIAREMFEETAIRVERPELLGVSTHRSSFYGPVMVLGFILKHWSGEPKAGSDALDVRFFSTKERPEMPFSEHGDLVRLMESRA